MGFKWREGVSCSSGVVHDIGRPRASSTRRGKVTTDRRLPRNELFRRAHHSQGVSVPALVDLARGQPQARSDFAVKSSIE